MSGSASHPRNSPPAAALRQAHHAAVGAHRVGADALGAADDEGERALAVALHRVPIARERHPREPRPRHGQPRPPVTQAANDTFANANRTINEIRDPVKAELADLQRTMTDARRLIADLNTVVSSNRNNIDDTLENFRVASENLRELTASVKQRPWTLIRGKPTPDRAVPVSTGAP